MVEDTERIKGESSARDLPQMRLNKYLVILLLVWTITVTASLTWNITSVKQNMLESAANQAKIAFEKDIQYRRWNAGHGGVYVPVTEETPPNPYLKDIVKERDITTPSGKQLTLMNPAYMTRQVFEIAEHEFSVLGHITSLNLIRPENTPDSWETAALKSFNKGETEVISVEKIEGREYMRLMRPLITEERCLKCHSAQGYKVGDIRGGISVSVPIESFRAIANDQILKLSITHMLLWLAGLFGLVLGSFRVRSSEDIRLKSEKEMIFATEQWRATFDSITDLVSVHNNEFRIMRTNMAFANFLRTKPEELIGKHCYEVVHNLDSPFPGCPHMEMLKTGKAETKEIFNTKYGLHLMITVSPIFERGEIVGSVHYIKDITERKKAEEELKKVNKAFGGRELKMAELKKEIEELKKKGEN